MASEEAQVKKEKAEKGALSFREMAIRNVSHARKAFPNDEGDKTATAGHLMQSAMVYDPRSRGRRARWQRCHPREIVQLGIAGSCPSLRPT